MDDKFVKDTEQRLEETFGGLEDEVKSELAKVAHEPTDNPVDEDVPPADPEEPEGEPTPEPEKEPEPEPEQEPADEPESEPEPTPEGTEPEAEEDKGLPDPLYRAAVHQGWKPEDIKEFYEGDPDRARKTFQNIYDSTNKLTAEFARLGRAKTEEGPKDGKEQEKPTVEDPKGVTQDELAALKEQYGEDDPLVRTIEGLQKKVETLSAPPAQTPQPQQPEPAKSGETQEVALQQTINNFFGGSEMQPYGDFYGPKESERLSEDQFKHRMEVLELADSILLGAGQLGRNMDVPEALNLAHLTVSEPVREKALRTDLKSKLVKRSRSVSLEPRGSEDLEPTGPTTPQEIEARAKTRLQKIFG